METPRISTPNLEILYLDCGPRICPQDETPTITLFSSNGLQPLDWATVFWLHQCPRLHTIDLYHRQDNSRGLDHIKMLDEGEHSTTPICLIRTYINKSQTGELIHIRMRLVEVEKPESLVDEDEETGISGEKSRIIFASGHKSHMYDDWDHYSVNPYSDPIWQDFTDFKKKMVPLSIISRMREADGMPKDDVWYRRGVVVGDEAWDILEDWYEEIS